MPWGGRQEGLGGTAVPVHLPGVQLAQLLPLHRDPQDSLAIPVPQALLAFL